MVDVTIVGAGPAGLFLAQCLKNLNVEIFEEHSEVGKPVQCAGLISRNVEEFLKVSKDCILNRVKGARLHSPCGNVIELSRKENEAYVIDREKFDKSLAEGLKINFGKKVSDLNFNSKFIIGADGPNSTVAKLAGFPQLEEVIPAVQYEIENKNHEKDFVEMYFGNKIAPGFFVWVIPAGKILRIGIAAKNNAKFYLENFIKKMFGTQEILYRNCGTIPLKWRPSSVKGNIVLVGDAAGQVKSATGGGIYIGMKSAKILAQAILNNNLEEYESKWREEIFPELFYSLKIREFMNKLPDTEMDNLFEILNKTELKGLLLSHGDMDKPSKLVQGIMKNPVLLAHLMPYLKYLW